jgi:hypothetical protein
MSKLSSSARNRRLSWINMALGQIELAHDILSRCPSSKGETRSNAAGSSRSTVAEEITGATYTPPAWTHQSHIPCEVAFNITRIH